jgi:hypothetical protein
MGQDDAETFQTIADTFAAMGQIMRARMFVYGGMAVLRQRRRKTAARPKAADAPA